MQNRPKKRLRAHHLLLLLPLLSLWVPFYDRADPALWGIPFFYWSQMAMIVATSVLLFIVYWLDRRGDRS